MSRLQQGGPSAPGYLRRGIGFGLLQDARRHTRDGSPPISA
jgi:hypothetical protein